MDYRSSTIGNATQRQVVDVPFYCGVAEVTIAQFRQFASSQNYVTDAERSGGGWRWSPTKHGFGQVAGLSWKEPGDAIVDSSPVTQVTFDDACEFCDWLSRQEGLLPAYAGMRVAGPRSKGYRLPDEATWEFACRAGTSGPQFFGDPAGALDDFAWNAHNSSNVSHPVMTRRPNPFGLYDVLGNVAEVCEEEVAAGSFADNGLPLAPRPGMAVLQPHISRGGSSDFDGGVCRSARRSAQFCPASARDGFRIVRRLDITPRADVTNHLDQKQSGSRPEKAAASGKK